MASGVPKFTSFRPKPKASPEPPKETLTPETVTRKSREQRRDKKKRPPTPEKPKIDRDAPLSKAYFSDRRGDVEVLRYGALNRYDIPAYRRFGYGCVLGLDSSQKIDREQSSDTKVYITPVRRQRQERLLTDKRTAKDGGRALRFIKPSSEQGHAVDQDFIAISSTRQKNHDSDDDDEPDLDYRGIEGKSKSNQPADPDTHYDSETEAVDGGTKLIKKNSELVRKTRDSPEDIQAWLNFIDHQEAMISLDQSSVELSDATRRQLAEVRIPIYEEALRKVPNDPKNHIELYKGLFKEGLRTWNEAKVVSKFKEVLELYSASTELWFMYLDFVQSNFVRFKYESCHATFVQCLEAIQAETSCGPETILHVLIRMTSMIQGAGYQELALAIWQALLEYHLLRPKIMDSSSLEDFWESEVPRIGELGAKGWRDHVPDDAPPGPTPLQSMDSTASIFEDFQKREIDATMKLRYPGRTSHDIGEEDAFHTIFYTDLAEYLKLIPMSAPSVLIVEAFLCFCGLPPLPRIAAHQRIWWKDPFLSDVGSCSVPPEYPRGESDTFDQKIDRFAACSLKSMQMTSEHLFEHEFPLDCARLGADFVRRLLKLIVASDPASDEVLAEYLLAFELRHFPFDVVKTAKQLLKARPSSQRLYHAYGLVESRRVNSAKASQVFSMAISLSNTKTVATYESLTLLSSWVWEALRIGDQVEALWCLVSLSGKLSSRNDPTVHPDESTLNVTRTAISEACEQALLRHDYPAAVTSTALLALLAYLPSTYNAEFALSTHQHLSAWFTSHKLSTSPHAELAAQLLAQFLSYHITHAPIVKPALVRTALEPLISQFPDNTILLSLYAANEARFAIDDRVRGIMHQTALHGSDERSIAGWSFAVHYETLKGEVAGSTAHSIRAIYKRATGVGAAGAHAPALWSSYLRFEIAQLVLERRRTAGKKHGKDGKRQDWERRLDEAVARVKDTFFQGLRSLPWCKDFAMLAFGDARDVFSEEELGKVYGVMLEKEVRVYVEVE